MCEPATALLVGSAALGVVSSLQQGRDAQAVANYNAALEANNARAARDQALAEENRVREDGRRFSARQRAQLAAQGRDPDTGTGLLAAIDTARGIELDALTVRAEGENRARGFENSSTLLRAEGKMARRQSLLSAGGKILGAGLKYAELRA